MTVCLILELSIIFVEPEMRLEFLPWSSQEVKRLSRISIRIDALIRQRKLLKIVLKIEEARKD